jgi:hypothetical protein
VPDLSWNPLDDPKANARYGEHFAEPVGPLKTMSPLGTDGSTGAAAIGPRSGTFSVTLVTVQLADKSVADTDAINMAAARQSIVNAGNYWSSMSNGRLAMTRVNEFRHKSSARHTDSYNTIMATVTRELGWQASPYKALVIFVPHADLNYNGSWGILGGGFTDSSTSGRVIMPYPSALTTNVVTHEFGHVLGLHHANQLVCNTGLTDVPRSGAAWADSSCWTYEYGDTSDLMGFAQVSSPAINSFLWDFGGFGRGDEIRAIDILKSPETHTLRPWAGTAANRALRLTDPGTGEIYYLEYRAPVGYDDASAVSGNRGVKITKQDIMGWSGNASIVLTPNSRNFGYNNRNLTWQAGQTFTTHGGTRITVNSLNADSASVTLSPAVRMSAIEATWRSMGGDNSSFGRAVTQETCGTTACTQDFANGRFFWTANTGANGVLYRGINARWQQLGAQNGRLGYPTTNESCGTTICGQSFQGGRIIYSPAGTHAVYSHSAIGATWRNRGNEQGRLSYPLEEENCAGTACKQTFANGTIHWTANSGPWPLYKNGITAAWQRSGAQNGRLGYPTSDEACGSTACWQEFQGGQLSWTEQGTITVYPSGISATWRHHGSQTGIFGNPTVPESCTATQCWQAFTNGQITWDTGKGYTLLTYRNSR